MEFSVWNLECAVWSAEGGPSGPGTYLNLYLTFSLSPPISFRNLYHRATRSPLQLQVPRQRLVHTAHKGRGYDLTNSCLAFLTLDPVSMCAFSKSPTGSPGDLPADLEKNAPSAGPFSLISYPLMRTPLSASRLHAHLAKNTCTECGCAV